MTFFDTPNREALTVDASAGAAGPRLGFLGAYEVSHDAQTRASSQFSIEHYFMEIEQDQIRRIREAGGDPHGTLSGIDYGWLARNLPGPAAGTRAYLDAARFFVDGGTPEQAEHIRRYDERILELQEQYPDLELLTSRGMFEEIQRLAREAEQQATEADTSIWGDIGAFFGSSLAALDPNTDPLNFATLPVAPGRTVATRVLAQAGVQGVTETINQLTGVQENRRLLGLDYGFSQAATSVVTTAIAGALFQGVEEGIRGLGRRWFRHAPDDPAPPASTLVPEPPSPGAVSVATRPPASAPVRPRGEPELTPEQLLLQPRTYVDVIRETIGDMNRTRQGSARVRDDIGRVATELERWDGQRPWAMTVRAETGINTVLSQKPQSPITFAPGASVDDLARRIDPDTFRVYDRLAQRRAQYRGWIDELGQPQRAQVEQQIGAIRKEIDDLQARIATANKRTAKKYEQRIRQMKAQIDELQAQFKQTDTPDMTNVRAQLLRTDERMRDLAPVISRAYARARDEWQLDRQSREAVEQMVRDGLRNLPPVANVPPVAAAGRPLRLDGPNPVERPLTTDVPILNTAPDIVAARLDSEDMADTVAKIMTENEKTLNDVIETWQSSLGRILKEAEEGDGAISIDGYEYRLNLDEKIAVPNEADEGFREVSVREMLDEIQEERELLQSVNACPLPTAS